MRVVWEIEAGTVEDVRSGLPAKRRGAYTTVQTVLNRLADRGLLERTKRGKAFVYTARLSEADYVADSLNHTLSGVSEQARVAALAHLVGGLDAAEMSEINSLAGQIAAQRKKR